MSIHWERVRAAIAGEPLEIPPVSLWRHFPEEDQQAESLAAATLRWQQRFGFDFVKLMPPGDYPVIAWGGASEYRGNPSGTRTVIRFPVTTPADWTRLASVPLDEGILAMITRAVTLVARELAGTVPILQTIFSPLTVAAKLSDGRVFSDLRDQPAAVRTALDVITSVSRELVRASLAAGADGIFFATQCATADVLDTATYAEWGRPWDLAVLEAAAGVPFVLLHLHGSAPHFDLVLDYPVHVLNWHDRRTAISLAEGERRSRRCVAGGIDEARIAQMSVAEVTAQAQDAIAQLGSRHLMVTPGCVIPVDTPAENVAAVVAAVRGAER